MVDLPRATWPQLFEFPPNRLCHPFLSEHRFDPVEGIGERPSYRGAPTQATAGLGHPGAILAARVAGRGGGARPGTSTPASRPSGGHPRDDYSRERRARGLGTVTADCLTRGCTNPHAHPHSEAPAVAALVPRAAMPSSSYSCSPAGELASASGVPRSAPCRRSRQPVMAVAAGLVHPGVPGLDAVSVDDLAAHPTWGGRPALIGAGLAARPTRTRTCARNPRAIAA
jgi:hypothetical protein